MKTLAAFLLLFPLGLVAQNDPDPAQNTDFGAVQMRWSFLGSHDKAAGFPQCDSIGTGNRDRCTAEAILLEIRKNLSYDPAQGIRPLEKEMDVEIDFVVNEYGEVKNIKVNASGDPRLTQSIINTLYALPRFTAASKGTASVGSKVMVAYPYTAIMQQ